MYCDQSSQYICDTQPQERPSRLFDGIPRWFVKTRLRVYQDLEFRKTKRRESPSLTAGAEN